MFYRKHKCIMFNECSTNLLAVVEFPGDGWGGGWVCKVLNCQTKKWGSYSSVSPICG